MKFLTKVALVLLAFASLNARADLLTNLGNVAVPSSINYGQSYSPASSGTTFWDDYTFTLTDASANSVTSSISLTNLLGISDMQARLYTGSNHYTGPVPSPDYALLEAWGAVADLGSGVSLTTVVLNPLVLAAGTYTLQLRGKVTGLAGGSYAGILNVAPVPEPQTSVMLFSGLLLLTLMTIRRKNNV